MAISAQSLCGIAHRSFTDCGNLQTRKANGKESAMRIYEVQERTTPLLEKLLDIWEQSVRVTHTFLSEEGLKRLKTYVPAAICDVEHLPDSGIRIRGACRFYGHRWKAAGNVFPSAGGTRKRFGQAAAAIRHAALRYRGRYCE